MNSNDVIERFNELCKCEEFVCSQSELEEFQLCGLIISLGKDKYMFRDSKIKTINVIKDKNTTFDLDFSSLINVDLSNYNTNKVYYMTKKTYNKYKEQGLIKTVKGNDYYSLYANEMWLVQIL